MSDNDFSETPLALSVAPVDLDSNVIHVNPELKEYAVIENDIVVNVIMIPAVEAATESEGNSYVQSLGYAEGLEAGRPQSPTRAEVGDQFDRATGRFQDDPDPSKKPPPPLEAIDPNDLSKGAKEVEGVEFVYNNDLGRWELVDIT